MYLVHAASGHASFWKILEFQNEYIILLLILCVVTRRLYVIYLDIYCYIKKQNRVSK